MTRSTSTFSGVGGTTIEYDVYEPAGTPKGLVLVAHGLGEHRGRYAHVADRRASRAGTVSSEVVLGGRKVAVRRPRVRAEGRGARGARPGPHARSAPRGERRHQQPGGRRARYRFPSSGR